MTLDKISSTILALAPGASWRFNGISFNDIEWLSPDIPMPSMNQIEEHIALQTIESKHQLYKIMRMGEYPPITDYIDGVVKGDQAQIDDYIAKCQAVKAKYPKPE
jgi:hypothetical protein